MEQIYLCKLHLICHVILPRTLTLYISVAISPLSLLTRSPSHITTEKRTKDLEERTKVLMKVRQTKAETSKSYRQKKIEAEQREKELIEQARQEAAIKLEAELREKREEKHREAAGNSLHTLS